MTRIFRIGLLCLLTVGCMAPPPVDPLAALRQADGSVLWQQEYAFVPPVGKWSLVSLDEDDYSVAFSKECREFFPCQSAMAYAEEPFGYSQDFRQRQAEFFKRYLWASRVVFDLPQLEETTLNGQPALVAVVEGKEKVKRHKVWSKVVFTRRGERVVAFYFNQWRPEDQAFDRADVADFDAFVDSFKFVKPSFFERL
ncbi:MAG: hypothetical protein A2X84_05850 [Desulfuromonadaceae bacterium GWC2_58_13]|nr:MAG: hypothetical protein A2X84_05850 [Desulfuromonadaceae bacterium GWC2_58_13]